MENRRVIYDGFENENFKVIGDSGIEAKGNERRLLVLNKHTGK
ncbi:hypothetical protein ACO2FQ_09680 [Lacticaseibacillus paracasei]